MDLCHAKTVTSTLLQVTIVDNVTVYCTTSLEVYSRLSRDLGRKIGPYIGRVDAADTRDQPREYNRMKPERSHSRQNL